jgi:hypothetical protein
MDKLMSCPFCGSEAAKSSDDPEYVMCSNWDCHLNSGLAKALPRDAWNTRHTEETGGDMTVFTEAVDTWVENQQGDLKKAATDFINDWLIDAFTAGWDRRPVINAVSPSRPTDEEMDAALINEYLTSDQRFKDSQDPFPETAGFESGWKAACKRMEEWK